jgi:ABC-2 type transport system permease protein
MSTLGGFLKKEFRQALRDPRMRVVLFIMPMVQLTLFGVAISNEVKNIRLSAPLRIEDPTLQHIYTRAIASGWFLPTHYDENEDPFELLRSGRVDAALVPPPGGLTKSLEKGFGQIQLLVDATNVVQGQAVESYLKAITARVLKDDNRWTIPLPKVDIAVRVLYNPDLKTSDFMVPGVMSLLMCIVTIILTSMSITREKEMGTFEMLISAPVHTHEVIFGKTIPYVVFGMSNVPLILAVAMLLFDVPMRGSFFILMLAAFVFVCTTVAIGTVISTFAKTQSQSTIGSFLFLFPAILLSGLMFPLENMPDFMKGLSYLNPLSHFLSLLRNIMLKGGESQFILFHVGVLILMALVSVVVSFRRFRTTLQD